MSDRPEDDDARLVERCRRGEQAAWAQLVRRYQRLVNTIVRRAGLDDHAAADVFQTVFSRLLGHLPRIEQPERLQAWIVTTAKREALLQRSRGLRHVSLTRDDGDAEAAEGAAGVHDIADEALLPDEALSEIQQAERVRRALDRIDERCRQLLSLLFGLAPAAAADSAPAPVPDDMPPAYDEIARRMDMPIGSIGPTRSRCLGKLRDRLGADD